MISRFNFGCWLISVYSLKRTKKLLINSKNKFSGRKFQFMEFESVLEMSKDFQLWNFEIRSMVNSFKIIQKNLPPVNEIQNSNSFVTLSQNGDKITTNWWQEFTSFKKILKPDEKCKTFLSGRFLHFDIALLFLYFYTDKKYFSTSIFIKKF